jgi:hypothetical protein
MASLDGRTRNRRIQDMDLKYGIGAVKDTSGLAWVKIDIEPFIPQDEHTEPPR